MSMLKSKHLLGLQDVSKEDIELILDTAKTMKMILQSKTKSAPHLRGKTVINLFYENSTRTRMSFELAAKYLGATSTNISASGSSVAKGETLIDTGMNLNMMGTDVIVMRHNMSGAPHLLSKNVHAAVVNAGDGMNEHPTQALLDMFTMQEHFGSLKGLKVAILGDAYHSRVVRSNIWGLNKMGAEVSVAGPATLMPVELEKMGAKVFHTVQEAMIDADVVMGLRIQLERQKRGLFPSEREYSKFFGVDEKRLSLANKGHIVMHPGPVNRGLEFSTAVVDAPQSKIYEQVMNGVAVRMAVLYLLTREEQ